MTAGSGRREDEDVDAVHKDVFGQYSDEKHAEDEEDEEVIELNEEDEQLLHADLLIRAVVAIEKIAAYFAAIQRSGAVSQPDRPIMPLTNGPIPQGIIAGMVRSKKRLLNEEEP